MNKLSQDLVAISKGQLDAVTKLLIGSVAALFIITKLGIPY